MKTKWQEKEKKEPVIPPTNTIIYPWAVMIECLEI